jgi:hypothetical protein
MARIEQEDKTLTKIIQEDKDDHSYWMALKKAGQNEEDKFNYQWGS